MITLEQGKTLADAEGDVFRGLREYSIAFSVLLGLVILVRLECWRLYSADQIPLLKRLSVVSVSPDEKCVSGSLLAG